MSLLDNFNNSTNSFLDTLYKNPIFSHGVYLFLILYGSLAAPSIPVSWGPILSHSMIRVLIMALIIWTSNHDVVLSVLIALGWMLTMNYLTKNALKEVSETGVVTPDVAVVISGGGGPSIQSVAQMKQEAKLMQASVNASKSPQAVGTSGPVSTGANQQISTLPSGTSANSETMMATKPATPIPQAFAPDNVQDLAVIPL